MRRLAAVLHTLNDGLRLGRCLETLYPCDEILIIDKGSTDQTLRIAREYGAKFIRAENGQPAHEFHKCAGTEWLLCLDTRESLTESLAASLFEWKCLQPDSLQGEVFSALLREETPTGWLEHPEPRTRLVPQTWQLWDGLWPVAEGKRSLLTGEVLRFSFP